MDEKTIQSQLETIKQEVNEFIHSSSSSSADYDRTLFLTHRANVERYLGTLEEFRAVLGERNRRKRWPVFTANILAGYSNDHSDQAQLQSLVSTIYMLKCHLNLLTPISKLPTELLHQILSLRVKGYSESFGYMTKAAPSPMVSLSWIGLTHVCRSWREVLLSDVNFWTHITPTCPDWAIEMVSRSMHAPLFVKADFFDLPPRGQYAAQIVLQQLSRIKKLSLLIPEPGTIGTVLNQPAPILESFAVRVYRDFRPMELSHPLFCGAAPNLRSISLESCHIPWDSPLFATLTSLRLENMALSINMVQFLDVFRGTPKLERLSLIQVVLQGLVYHDGSFVPAPPVILPLLVKVTLSASSYFCGTLLNYLRLPAHPSIFITCSLRASNLLLGPLHVVTPITRHLNDERQPIQHLFIENIPNQGLRIQGWSGKIEHKDARCCLGLYLKTPEPMTGLLNASIPAALLSHLPLKGNIQSLRLNGFDFKHLCPDGVGALENLRTLIIQDNVAFHEWLSAANEVSLHILPNLKTIVIGDDATLAEIWSYDLMAAYLVSRRREQLPIHTLELRSPGCWTPDRHLHLQSLVTEVSWVGIKLG